MNLLAKICFCCCCCPPLSILFVVLISVVLSVFFETTERYGDKYELYKFAANDHKDYPGLRPLEFQPLPLGSIKPEGWMHDQLKAMAAGLAGHQFDFYKYVKNSTWLGGDSEYSDLREGFPYWLQGIVPLAYELDDARLKGQIRTAVNYVLAHQQDDGWLGPEVGTQRNFWGRTPLVNGLTQLVEADPKFEEQVVPALHRYVDCMRDMLRDDSRGYVYHKGDEISENNTITGRIRAQETMLPLQWLYEHRPMGNEVALLDVMNRLFKGAWEYKSFYSRARNFDYNIRKMNRMTRREMEAIAPLDYFHGVNFAQGLKQGIVFSRYNHNDRDRNSSRWLKTHMSLYHKSDFGPLLADNLLAGVSAYSGAELCAVVELIYSMSYLYQAYGDAEYADYAELTAYNALPAMLTPDMWARQHVIQSNQPYSRKLDPSPFTSVGAWGQTFSLESGYPCCTVNHHQGFPRFLANSFVRKGKSGLVHALLAPASVRTSLGGNEVTVKCETNYPFEDTFTYYIHASAPFDFYVRIPEWRYHPYSSIRVITGKNEIKHVRSFLDSHTGLQKFPLPAGSSKITIASKIQPRSRNRDHYAHTFRRGPLVYALAIPATITSTPPKDFRDNAFLPKGYAPPRARDYQMLNATPWNVAVDPDTLALKGATNTIGPDFVPLRDVWDETRGAGGWIEVAACYVEWNVTGDVPDIPPVKPAANKECLGAAFTAKLIPLGRARLHMVDLPGVRLGGGGRTGGVWSRNTRRLDEYTEAIVSGWGDYWFADATNGEGQHWYGEGRDYKHWYGDRVKDPEPPNIRDVVEGLSWATAEAKSETPPKTSDVNLGRGEEL